MKQFKRCLAEFFGTLILVLFACGTASVCGASAEADAAYLLTALSFGLVLCVLCYAIGPVSGCHVNPAVSLAKFAAKEMGIWDCLSYVVSQCLGALCGGGLLYLLVGAGAPLGENALYAASAVKSLGVEAVLTCLFVFVVLAVSSNAKYASVSGIVCGAALTLVHVFGIALTGTSVNPARSLGVALFAGGEALRVLWVFWVGPLAGALLAALLYRLFVPKAQEVKKSAAPAQSAPQAREKKHEAR